MDRIIKSSIISGMLIGIGVNINVFLQNKYIGAMLFSFSLLSIIKLQLMLYTGQIGFLINKKFSLKEYTLMFVGNCSGVLFSTILLLQTKSQSEIKQIYDIASTKFSHTYFELFICSLFCGVLMFVAVKCKDTVITIFCIMIFILSGFTHCIADFPFLILLSPSVHYIVKFAIIVSGNSIGSIISNILINNEEINGKYAIK